MKIIKILLAVTLLGACAPYATKGAKEPQRNYPVFLQNGLAFAAFKAEGEVKGNSYAALLTLKAEEQSVRVKVTGDFAATLLEAVFDGNNFVYKSSALSLDEQAQTIFEDIIKTLIQKPQNFAGYSTLRGEDYKITFKGEPYLSSYYFKKGLSFPYKLEQKKLIVQKVFTFEDYQVYGQSTLPTVVNITDGHGFAKLKLTLLSVK
jgi:hypothetical protein